MSMLYALENSERLESACPSTASYRECFDHLDVTRDTTPSANVADLFDRPRKDDAATRARVKRELLAAYFSSNGDANTIVTRARDFVPLVAIRLRIEILRNGRCPTATELDAPPYSTLRAPSVLGSSIPVTPIDHALRVDPPAWLRDHVEQDRKTGEPPAPPSPASPQLVSLPCP